MFNTVESNYPTNSIQKEAWLKSILIRECPPVAHIEDSSSSTLLQVSVNCSCTLTHRCYKYCSFLLPYFIISSIFFIFQLVIGRMTQTMDDSLIRHIPIMHMAIPTAISLSMYRTHGQESLCILNTFCLGTEEETVPMMLTSRLLKISNYMNKNKITKLQKCYKIKGK